MDREEREIGKNKGMRFLSVVFVVPSPPGPSSKMERKPAWEKEAHWRAGTQRQPSRKPF